MKQQAPVSPSQPRKNSGALKSLLVEAYPLGLPVEEKAGVLDTEIGTVAFTEDLIVGFDSQKAPETKQEAKKIVVEAADRYARLTAYLAAEMGVPAAELIDRNDLAFTEEERRDMHPRRVLEAVERARTKDVANQIVAALDGTAEEDQRILVNAARAHVSFLYSNIDELSEPLDVVRPIDGRAAPDERFGVESNLRSAMKLFEDVERHDAISLISSSEVTPLGDAEYKELLDGFGRENLRRLTEAVGRQTTGDVVERMDAGVRMWVKEDRFVEITVRRKPPRNTLEMEVCRVILEEGKPVVYGHTLVGNSVLKMDVFDTAVDFTKPVHPHGSRRKMVGFSRRDTSS